MIADIVLAGVGGQGVVLASNLLARAFMEAGFYVKQSEIHGMAQRGGSVTSFVRRGKSLEAKVYAPTVEPGRADALIAFEKLEALRFAHYVRPDGLLVYSTQEIIPTSVALGAPYPADIDASLHATRTVLVRVDVLDIALKCKNPRVGNVALVGALADALSLDESLWDRAVRATVPRALEANLEAFRLGREAASNARR
jgi:indolepyruvate ferredoxin oxidoreductase beta subunit